MTLQRVSGSTSADESGQVFVYRPDAPVERLAEPDSVSADPVLPGFRLEMDEIRKILHAEDR